MVIPRAWGVHHGPKPTEGHYVAYGAKGRSMATCFNDSKVSQVDLADVDEALISHVLLEFTRANEESAKASRKRTHEAANLKRAAIHLKKLKAEKLMNPGDGVISQIVGGMSITVGPKTKAAECSKAADVLQGASDGAKAAEADVLQGASDGAKASVPKGANKEASKGAKATRKPTREMEGCEHYANDPAIEPGFDSRQAATTKKTWEMPSPFFVGTRDPIEAY